MNTERLQRAASLIDDVRVRKPLVHQITNYVTVNDCANITLAISASPIMADAIEEAADIAAIASALVLNIGTLNARTVESMIAAGVSANRTGIPVVLDPVGAGASGFRNQAIERIIKAVKLAAVRGNISEIGSMLGLSKGAKGVDASDSDSAADPVKLAQALAKELCCVVAITGAVDTVSDGTTTVRIENGHPQLASITGTGCMCTALVGSFLGARPDQPLFATAMGVASMGIAGERAHRIAGAQGNGSFRAAILDAISGLNANIIMKEAKFHGC